MRRNARPPLDRLRRGARHLGRLTFAFLLPAAPAAAQQGIPFAPGVVLTYVMHNYDSPHDWEFQTIIDSIEPDETVYLEDIQIRLDDTTWVRHPYRRHVSRRELAGARAIDHGGACNPADTLDTTKRGSTLRMASQRLLRQLKAGGPVEVSSYLYFGCSQGLVVSGTLQWAGQRDTMISILLNDRQLVLPTVHARGEFHSFDARMDEDYWFLDDTVRAWMVRNEGRWGERTYVQQLGRIYDPATAVAPMVAGLSSAPKPDGMCRAPVYGIYFDFNRADLLPESRSTLAGIAAVLRQHADWVITIEGHTDSIGGARNNLDLSNRRAAAVKRALVQQYGIPDARLAVKGYGLTRPVEPNGTIEGRARNRRVELARTCH